MATPQFDVIVVGGSYAGMSAAMPLVRARRKVAVIDAGLRRNRFAATSHGFLTQDGRAPGAIAADARAQLLAYPTLTWIEGTAATAAAAGDGFTVGLGSGEALTAHRLILATGVVDELPEIPGLAERWGTHVFACPYCHGYELNNGRIGVIAVSPLSVHIALLLPDWGTTTLFLNGAVELDAAQRAQLAARGVAIEETPIARLTGETPIVELTDGRALPMDGLFVKSHLHPASPLAEQLGCALDDGPMGIAVRTDEMKATSVPGVFACGDTARLAGSVSLAVGDGAIAGTATHRSLIFQ